LLIIIFVSILLLFLVLNFVKWVLVTFKESKFCLNQSHKVLNTVLLLLLKSVVFELDSKMRVSSANKIGTDLSFTNLGKSFINMRKNKGPKTKPWGTPCSVLVQRDVVVIPFSFYNNVL
jgi:hypothetical protein